MPTIKSKVVQTRVNLHDRGRLKTILDRLGLSESEYIRGALQARMRVDERKLKKEGENA